MIYKKYENENYNLYTIKTDKFKTCHLEVIMRNKLDKKQITINNMLIDCLTYTTKLYPQRKNLVEKLEDLYDAAFYGVTSRVGQIMFSNIILNFLDPKFCDKNFLREILTLPFEALFNPNINNGEFDLKTFNIIKSRNRADILSVKEDATRYALKQAIINMDKNSPSGFMSCGYLKDLEQITPEDLAEYYQKFIRNSVFDIYVIGNLDMDYVAMTIQELFHNNYLNEELDIDLFVPNKVTKKVKDIVETGDYAQSSLVLVYNTNDFTEKETNYTVHLFNYIFGNGSLTTKLYKYLREENSMCYSTYSIYQKLDQLMLVYVGIESKNKKKCVKLINKALKEMCQGDFTEEDIQSGKKMLKADIMASLDNPSSILDNYMFHNVIKTPFLKDRIKEIDNVTKEEIVHLAKKIKLNTIYLLGGNTDEEN